MIKPSIPIRDAYREKKQNFTYAHIKENMF